MSYDPLIVDDTSASRLEAKVGDLVAELVYRVVRGRLVIVHTGVPDELEGGGVGGKLVAAALNKAIEGGLTVVPECPFAASWLRKHPEDAAKATIEWPRDR